MFIGITYDLREDYLKQGFSMLETAEFDHISTIDAIDAELKKLGHKTERIGNIKSLVQKLNAGKKWDLVFNICEGMYGLGREAQVPAILEAYDIPYSFSDSLVMALTLHKGFTKNIIRDNGIATPNFFVVNKISDVEKINLPFPLFAKPVAEGTGKGVTAASKVSNKFELNKVCENLLKQFNQAVLVETFLPGREFTVGIFGTGERAKSLGVIEVVLKDKAAAEFYSFENKEECETKVEYKLVNDESAIKCSALALEAWKVLGCSDAGRVDIKLDEKNVPNFLEVNPLSGLHPTHSDLPILCNLLQIPYKNLISQIIDSAMERVKASV